MKRHASMNRVYRLIWSHVYKVWVPVAEIARGRRKGSSRKSLAAARIMPANLLDYQRSIRLRHWLPNPQMSIGICALSALLVSQGATAAAIAASPSTKVGDTVTNPVTGVDATVIQLIKDPNGVTDVVLTSNGDLIQTKTVVGDTIQPAGGTAVYQVISVVTNPTTGLVDTINVRLTTAAATDPTSAQVVATNASADFLAAATANAGTPGIPAVVPAQSTSGIINEISQGSKGGNGSNAYGVEICFGKLGCVTIAKTGSAGGDGGTGPTVNRTVDLTHGPIGSTIVATNGISVGSVGGNGGRGGDSYGNIKAYRGGQAGNGGSVTLNNATTVSTTQDKSHGIYGVSLSGTGGDGGTGYIFAGGGSGGAARDGGKVSVTNTGEIGTDGNESHGIYVLSVGGAAGDGGGSWGIVGAGGSGANGGNGGDVSVDNNALISTKGIGSHGILAQSIGGTGGNGGAAGGIVGFGGDASTGGVGGNVSISNQENADIQTFGRGSVGVFGQSIGGGGGDSGAAGGIVGLGASGGSGNNAGTVTIANKAGSRITTKGQNAHGVFAQSIGGGGGNTSPTGGVVNIGGTSAGGGNGSTVTIESSAIVNTAGENAHGIFAQSIGGGGGSAGASGGLLSLGGSGAAGGNGGAVTVTNKKEGSITTTGIGAHAILAQSIGGGGGAGGDSGGLVSIGGKGSGGGNGSTVSVTNSGILNTSKKDAKGIFAQSIGGGGGSGGGSGGLVSLGGGGSAGSSAGAVTVSNNAKAGIYTLGDGSDAVFAQSIGGGGGAGASSGGLVSLGGSGSGGGNGGRVSVTNDGYLSTEGLQARGIFAQSIGGGGGSGGNSGGLAAIGGSGSNASNADNVVVINSGNIDTKKNKSTAIFAESVGGGGGDGGSSGGPIAIGGSGGSGGDAGTVSVTHGGRIITQGHDAMGIFAQAIGGGGGNGGAAYSGSLFAGLALGGNGSLGGDGKTVTVTLNEYDLLGTQSPSIISTSGDRSTGILAQSVGGGGGNGGNAVQGTVGTGVSMSVALGGSGGAGGAGGTVELTGKGNVFTGGKNAAGVILQSVGGGGGNGGSTVSGSGSIGDGVGISVALGGTGGDGGDGGLVSANVASEIQTDGELSSGFVAQSVGGGGGNGGTSISAAAAGGSVGAAAIAVGVGGNAGDGGTGGHVDVALGGSVVTKQAQSDGVVIQSVGGGGGNGGATVAAGAAGAGGGAGNVTVGVGGAGGGGGNAGRVDATLTNNVETLGDGSDGVIVQSIGGGGGNSGLTVSAGVSGAGVGAGGINLGLGGSGGQGGNGDIVDADYAGTLITHGDNATGLLAQSVGGGGGNSSGTIAGSLNGAGEGSGSIALGVGGNGGGAGNGGRDDTAIAVTLDTSGEVTTYGNRSSGVIAQSIGGGGGNGGYSIAASLSGGGEGSGAVSVGLGGGAGSGGNGKGVVANLKSTISTKGSDSIGALIQSIGGGGGNGGFNVSVAASGAGTGSGTLSVGLGGAGDSGGNGGEVVASTSGDITTQGDFSGGVLAQSVGGGGGNGGFDVAVSGSGAGTGSGAVAIGLGGSGAGGGNGSKVALTVNNNVSTQGKGSAGTVAQSLGGGGGNGGINVSGSFAAAKSGSGALGIGIGGMGGGGGDAADVTNDVTGLVQTLGDNSIGILAQSSGGGGGNGGLNVTGDITASNNGSGGLAVGIGGFGGDGGDGNAVINTVTGGVLTSGNDSTAIIAQSLGGGGGNGALNVSGALNLSKDNGGALGVGIGGFGGGGGNASSVTSTVKATQQNPQIVTKGNNASAVVAQSLGGGGGNGGLNVTGAVNLTGKNGAAVGVGLGGFGGGAGNSGKVKLDVTSDIVTLGNESHGLLAQSIGGSGGSGGTNVTGSLAFTNSTSGSAKTVAASIGVGGFGGGGGSAGDVGVTYAGTIVAEPSVWVADQVNPTTGVVTPAHYEIQDGTGSHGIAAQSIGGGGGNGGINVSGGISYARGTGDGYGLIVGFGGFGGDGGDAGNVDVKVSGGESISGYGAEHSAILAQSVGGGGGNGALNVSGGVVSDSPLIVGVGGFGADAGVAKNVNVDVAANVYTQALDSKDLSSAGIMAQSLGGGGGNGGMNISGGLAINKEATVPSLTTGVGGFGGTGAVSGDVTVKQVGDAVTAGNWIHGVMAQSIAGGGGNGAVNVSGELNLADSQASGGKKDLSLVAGVGGTGGKGADAGKVSVTQDGVVTTKGDNARGVAAQSIGGGGGTGGLNVTGVFTKNSSPINVGIGGKGSGGGHASAVTVNRGSVSRSTGRVTTDGDAAYGIEASSIGGGGGDAGMNFNAAISLAGANNTDAGFSAEIAIGGSGGEAGNGSTSQVTNYSDIETKQDNSHGILAQSIGGGGGNANFNIAAAYEGKNKNNLGFNLSVGGAPGDGGSGGEVNVVQVGNVETHGNTSFGILSQSIGGGGGNTGMDFAFTKTEGGKAAIKLGRVGGTGGFGSDVSLSSKGAVITHGDGSFGMLAQSIGNGGGNSSASSVSAQTASSEEKPSKGVSLAVGLEGGQGGRGGNVTLDAEGWVGTEGKNAHAIFAQSVGGGGGNGGMADTFSKFGSAPIASLSLGGTGGEGGIGGTVTVKSSAEVRTNNDDSVGIFAQSVGGGGGNGGMAISGGINSKVSGLTVAVGGDGGVGMTGGMVTVDNSGVIITDGEGSHGLLAQSLGGGGGNSGMVINSILTDAGKEPSKRAAISIGGTGGEGATGGDVTVTNSGGIGTTKDNSIGIFAQSIGGGGGNSKNIITNVVSGVGGSNSLSVGLGGTGGTGASAGNVSVFNVKGSGIDSGKIITEGNYSHGILAMSVGGSGGTGSTTVSTKKAATTASTTTSNSYAFSLGGDGGTGGTGGQVYVANGGEITTYGYKAHGILAQSVGGGGGNGGMAITGDLTMGTKLTDSSTAKSGTFSLGGSGGDGNTSGDVTVNNTGSIEVFGNRSDGIFAQSVGGGGGDGGFAATLSRNILSNPKTGLKTSLMNVGAGGNGGDGADSGNVLVNHAGTITAHGDNAYGIFAQSVSGGGGNVGHSLTSPAWMAADLAISTLVGGRDGSKGRAGTVTVDTQGDIFMLGKNSTAQFTQSVNGGGGNVDTFLDVSKHAVALGDDGFELPDNGGDVDNVEAFISSTIKVGTDFVEDAVGSAIDHTHAGDLYTSGKNSLASLIQSIGGGGGNSNSEVVVESTAHVDLVLALGGASSANNNGGNVTQNRQGNIATDGDQSAGANVQSIGGGGGNLTVNVQRVPEATISPASAAPAALAHAAAAINAEAVIPGVKGTAVLGADGGTASHGGDLELTSSGDVMTSGKRAYGLMYQSIGAGGGKLELTGFDNAQVAIGGKNGSSGNGGNITLSNKGSIKTAGELSNGINIQSIGGGGGAVFTDLEAGHTELVLNNTNTGNGGDIGFTQAGDIVVTGNRSIAVFAQSLGGGGGSVDRMFADTAGGAGAAGSVNLALDGNVVANGEDGVAVFAQSRAADGQGNITISLAEDKILYAGKNGIAVSMSGGEHNNFSNHGSIATEDGLQGWTVKADGGNTVIDNYGEFYGQFDLAGGGANRFVNHLDHTLVSGENLLLGNSANQLINDGILAPGGNRLSLASTVTGSFLQTDSGKSFYDLDLGPAKVDSVLATGTANIAGTVDVAFFNEHLVKPGHFKKVLFSGEEGLTDNGISLLTHGTSVIRYDDLIVAPTSASLGYSVDFSPRGLNGNQTAFGNYINKLQLSGGSERLGSLVGTLFRTENTNALRATYNMLTPETQAANLASTLLSANDFNNALMSCREQGGTYRFVSQGECGWMRFVGRTVKYDNTFQNLGYKEDAIQVAGGAQKAVGENKHLGFAVSYEDTSSQLQSIGRSQGQRVQGGMVIKGRSDATTLTASVVGGYGWFDTARSVGINDLGGTAKATQQIAFVSGHLQFARMFEVGKNNYFRPMFEPSLTNMHQFGVTESGGGSGNLSIKARDELFVALTPALEFGSELTFGDTEKPEATLRPRIKLGVTQYVGDSQPTVVSNLVGTPTGGTTFATNAGMDQTLGNVEVGIDLITHQGATVRMDGLAQFGEHTELFQGGLKVTMPF